MNREQNMKHAARKILLVRKVLKIEGLEFS